MNTSAKADAETRKHGDKKPRPGSGNKTSDIPAMPEGFTRHIKVTLQYQELGTVSDFGDRFPEFQLRFHGGIIVDEMDIQAIVQEAQEIFDGLLLRLEANLHLEKEGAR